MSNLPSHRPTIHFLGNNNGAGPSSSTHQSVGSSIYSRPLTRPAGIMRQRLRQPEPEEPTPAAAPTDSRIDNLVTNFIVANGLPFDVVRSESFKSLLRGLNPRIVLPTPKVIESCSEKLGNPGKPLVNYQKTTGPMSVTLHITNTANKHYLAFSIHYLNENKNRRDVIYLRELMLSRLDENSLLTTLRRAVNQFNYATVKFTNLVAPNEEVYELLNGSEIIKRIHICFYHYLSQFVGQLVILPEYASGIEQLRMFVDSVKENADYYSKFRRMQLTKSGDLDLPTVDYNSWDSVTSFLTRCLSLHDTFVDFADRFHVPNYITHEVFLQLVSLYRILVHCVKAAKSFGLTSSISQIMPTIYGLHRCIQDLDVDPSTAHEIQAAFTRTFTSLTRASDRYDVASLLDPRYAYKETVYGSQQWSHIEKKLMSEFLEMQVGHQNDPKLLSILSTSGRQERTHILHQELRAYRQLILGQRPEEYHNPFVWWSSRSEIFDVLSVFARDYLACPAVVIDADYHFGAGGKFSHVCKNYSHKFLENVLNAAGLHQRFEGRGVHSSFPSQQQQEQINSSANRRRKELNLQRMSNRKRMYQNDEYYSPSNFAKKQATDPNDEQKPSNDCYLTLHSPKREPEDEMESFTPSHHSPPDPAASFPIDEQKPDMHLHLSSNVNTKGDEPSESTVEQKPDASSLFADVKKEIKDEPLSEDEYEEPVEEVPLVPIPPPKRIIVSSANRPAGIVRTLNGKIVHVQSVVRTPTTTAVMFPPNRPNPQVVQKANFVQKFAQKQNFVQKFTPRNPESGPRQQQFNKPDWTNGVKISLEEGKPENVGFDLLDGSDDPENSYNAVLNRIEGNRFYVHKVRKPCNRRCAVCSSMEEHENLKNVTIDTEKLMIVLGATYRNEMTIAEAANCVGKPTKTYMCRVHFSEACDEIFKMLRVTHPEEIATCSSDLINNALITVSQIRQRKMTVPELRQLLVHFVNKYWEAPQPTRPNDDDEFGLDEGEILPKTHRQPRKQVLEEDQHDSTVKLIEQEDFKLPKVKPADDTAITNFEQPEFCRYCSEHNTRTDMVRVPKGEDKVIRWLHALGQEFGKRLRPEGENYICRSHFDKDSFSSRGRLLKGMLPNVKPDKVSITYKIFGDNFLKLGEERSGREKDATFDLENANEEDAHREDSCEDTHDYGSNLYEQEDGADATGSGIETYHSILESQQFQRGNSAFEETTPDGEERSPDHNPMDNADKMLDVKRRSIRITKSSSVDYNEPDDEPSSSQSDKKKPNSRKAQSTRGSARLTRKM